MVVVIDQEVDQEPDYRAALRSLLQMHTAHWSLPNFCKKQVTCLNSEVLSWYSLL